MSSLREELRGIYNRAGALTPALVVQESRPVSAPLHDRFLWDNKAAGEAYRRVQAAELIRSVRVTYGVDEQGRDKKVREFLSVQARDRPDSTYRPVDEVMGDEFSRELVLREARREWQQFKARYGALAEFAAIVAGEASAA